MITCLPSLGALALSRSTYCAGSVIPSLPAIVKETLNLLFNMAPIKSVDVYASTASGWWGASMQIQGTGGIGALLGAFNAIAQEFGFPSLGNFQPRMSIAGKLTGNGLPIAIGECSMADGQRDAMLNVHHSTCTALQSLPNSQSLLLACCRLGLQDRLGRQHQVAILLWRRWRLPIGLLVPGRQSNQSPGWHLHQDWLVRMLNGLLHCSQPGLNSPPAGRLLLAM